jgi:hypothetical protein
MALLALSNPSRANPAAFAGLAGVESQSLSLRPFSIVLQAQAGAQQFSASDINGAPGKPAPVRIVLPESGVGPEQLFMFTGLPAGVKLSAGASFGDFWAVHAKDLPKLSVVTPANFNGTFNLKITRARTEKAAAHSAVIKVTIGDAGAAPAAAPSQNAAVAIGSGTGAAQPVPGEHMLMERATKTFKTGDVSGARVIFEYLAMKGSAAAAMAMGETYDPLVLSKLFIKGVEADPAKAQEWYRKAEQLGSGEARNRLNALAAK